MIAVLPIPQITAPGTVERRLSLPSFLLRFDGNLDPRFIMDGFRTPFGVVGEYARRIASEQPDRVIAAAKSWCHGAVDRTSPLLPFESESPELRLSPLEATTAYLMHLVDAWGQQFSDAPFSQQRVVLTVPASFDLDARELTKQAALTAGFPEDFVFLESRKQRSTIGFTHKGDTWRKQLKRDDTLLVCDVGGGTTDLTLVQVTEENGELELSRLAVGKHLLVGGDNMDLTLAHVASHCLHRKAQTKRLAIHFSVAFLSACQGNAAGLESSAMYTTQHFGAR